ncbi:hypothetical protein BSLA_02f0757 [Burkholderia stabilis]|nr:hypothetical protein BSLA_02f0757 [Burkholderia stabilis]
MAIGDHFSAKAARACDALMQRAHATRLTMLDRCLSQVSL